MLVARGGVAARQRAVGGQSNGAPASRRVPQRGGTITVLSAGDVDHIDPGAAYYSFTYEITYATQRPLLAYKPSSVKADPRSRGRDADGLEGRQDGHGAHQATASASARPSTAR